MASVVGRELGAGVHVSQSASHSAEPYRERCAAIGPEQSSSPNEIEFWVAFISSVVRHRYEERCSVTNDSMFAIPPAVSQVLVNVSALSEARFHERVKGGMVLCAHSIEPFERSRPWFAADAGPMEIQLREGAV